MVIAAGALIAVDADVAVAGFKQVLDQGAFAERSHVSAALDLVVLLARARVGRQELGSGMMARFQHY